MEKKISTFLTVCFIFALCSHGLWADTPKSDQLDQYASRSGSWIAAPGDWPHWRGPEMNGISREKGLIDRWNPKGGEGSNVLWVKKELGSRSTPIVMNGKLYTIVRDQPRTKKEREKVVCLDAGTGKFIWENTFNVYQSDVPNSRVGWSSVVGDPKTGKVYALGVCGYFQCLDGETGKTLWSHSLSEEYGLLTTFGGRTNFPFIHGNLVIISGIIIGWGDMAKPTHRFIAFDKRNGQSVWFEGTRVFPFDTNYSSPVTTVINGQAMMIFGSGDGAVHAFQPQTGKKIWSYQVSPKRGLNVTPLVVGNIVVSGHSEENVGDNTMGLLVAIDATRKGKLNATGELWKHKEWMVGKSSPICVNDRVYAADDKGTLFIADLKSGKMISKFKLRDSMRGSPLYADGKIYVMTVSGIWWTLKPTPTGVKRVFYKRMSGLETYASPIAAQGRIYLSTSEGLFCLGTKGKSPVIDSRPEIARETPLDKDQTPAQIQIVPVESLLRPGAKQQFQVRLFNANGQYLGLAGSSEVEFKLEGEGTLDSLGTYQSPLASEEPDAVKKHHAIIVKVAYKKMTGRARIRVVPDLPWSFDFEDGKVPVTWVGARYRHIVLDHHLLTKLTKTNKTAGQFYIYLMTGFQNDGTNRLVFDNGTIREKWSSLLDYFDLLGKVTQLSQAQKSFNASLDLLKKERVISGYRWVKDSKAGIRLTVEKGSRPVVGKDGNGVMVKIKTIPKGQRSQGWMGHPDFSNYTIQADVLGAQKKNKMPDIGLAGQRYVIDLMGAKQQIQIRTWHTELRMSKSVPFAWKPEVWYTMKMKASVEGGKAFLRGKVWKKGETEPEDWMVEAVDEIPNTQGSPGLFGNAIDAEIFYDNIKVTKN